MECEVKTSDCKKRSYESVCFMLCSNKTATTIATATMVWTVAAAVITVKTRRSLIGHNKIIHHASACTYIYALVSALTGFVFVLKMWTQVNFPK